MARRAAVEVSSAFRQVQQQARSLLVTLRREIRTKESELERLREEERRLSSLATTTPAANTHRGPGGGKRVDWRKVLSQLPKQFKASDIRRVRGLQDKRPSEIFAAVTRWMEAGLVKRKDRGVYERTT